MGESVDPTGLTFTVTYSDGTEPALVSPQAHTPTTWGETAGTQTCTFTYTEDGESVSCAVEATVIEHAAVLTSLNITGTPAAQYVGQAPDLTGLTFKAVYSDTSEETVDASDITVSPATWAEAGSATLTCSYTEDETTVSDTVSVTVHVNFEVSGTMPAQYQNRNVDTTGMSYTYNGVAVDPSDVTVSPASWEAAGTGETVTFTYDQDTATKTADVFRTVANLPVVQTSTYDTTTAVSEDVNWFRNCIPSAIEYPNPDDPGHWYTGIYFVLDIQDPQYTPKSLNEGDIVWWYQPKTDYLNDQANGCNASDMMDLLTGYGIFDGSSNPGLLFDIYKPTEFHSGNVPDTSVITDFGLIISLNGSPQAQSAAEYSFVVGQAKGSVADASTLKPSDVDLLAVWHVTFTV